MIVQAAQDTTTTATQSNLPGVGSSDIEALFNSQLALAQSLTGRTDLLGESSQPQSDDSTRFQQALALQSLNFQASVAMMQHNISGVTAVQTMINQQLSAWGFGQQSAETTASQKDSTTSSQNKTSTATQKTATTKKATTAKKTNSSTTDTEAASNASTASSSSSSLSEDVASNASSTTGASSSLTDTLLSNASTASGSTASSGASDGSDSTNDVQAELDRLIEQVGQTMGALVQNTVLSALQMALQSMTAANANGLISSTGSGPQATASTSTSSENAA